MQPPEFALLLNGSATAIDWFVHGQARSAVHPTVPGSSTISTSSTQ